MARADKKKIDSQHMLPCDFVCMHMRFRKGVKLETVRAAAERWLKAVIENQTVDLAKAEALRRRLASPTPSKD